MLVFSKTTGFRHDSIDEGIAAIKALGDGERLPGRRHRGRHGVPRRRCSTHYDTVVFLSTTGDPLNDGAAGRVRGLHPGRRRLHRHPRRGRHRVRLARGTAGLVGGYFRNHPRRDAEPRRSTSRTRITRPRAASPTPWPRVDEWYNYQSPVNPSPGGGGTDYSPRRRTSTCSPRSTRRPTTRTTAPTAARRPSDLVVPALRRRPLVVHGHGPHRGVVRRGAVPAAPPRRPRGHGGRGGRRRRAASSRPSRRPGGQAFADPASGTAPLHGELLARRGLDPNGGGLTYRWTFSDGGTVFGSSVTRRSRRRARTR